MTNCFFIIWWFSCINPFFPTFFNKEICPTINILVHSERSLAIITELKLWRWIIWPQILALSFSVTFNKLTSLPWTSVSSSLKSPASRINVYLNEIMLIIPLDTLQFSKNSISARMLSNSSQKIQLKMASTIKKTCDLTYQRVAQFQFLNIQ